MQILFRRASVFDFRLLQVPAGTYGSPETSKDRQAERQTAKERAKQARRRQNKFEMINYLSEENNAVRREI